MMIHLHLIFIINCCLMNHTVVYQKSFRNKYMKIQDNIEHEFWYMLCCQFTLDEKFVILGRLENGEKNSVIAKEFSTSSLTISTIWKNWDTLKNVSNHMEELRYVEKCFKPYHLMQNDCALHSIPVLCVYQYQHALTLKKLY